MSLRSDAQDLLPDLVALRRTLHQIPEVGLHLPRTQEHVLAALEGLPLEITTGTGSTSVVAVLRGGRPGPAVLLRGDMDALPIAERSGEEFASTNGNMHACGHDLHVAGLVGAARLLCARRDEIAGSVVFMFQPGEERLGGARVMLAEGVLDAAGERVVAAYGIHVATGAFGVFQTRPGPFMAGSNELHVTVHGKGGHGSQPHTALDPVPALLEIGIALNTMVTRRFSVFDPVVVTVTQLKASDAINVIPQSATLGATVRALSSEHVDLLVTETRRLAEGIAAAHGCTVDVELKVDYPVTANDPGEAAFVADTLTDLFGASRFELLADPRMASEDFSYVLEQVPGAFIFLGCTPPDRDWTTEPWNHSAAVVFDDAVLGDQAAALAALALRRLSQAP